MKKTIGELKRMSSPWLFVWKTQRQRQKSLGKTNPWRALQCPLTSSPMFLLTMLQRKFAKLDDKKYALYETPKYKMVGFFSFGRESDPDVIFLWDRTSHQTISKLSHRLPGQKNGVSAVAFHPRDQEVLVTVADDYKLRVWKSRNRLNSIATGTMR